MSARTAVRDALRATGGYLSRKTEWLNRPATWRTWVVLGLLLIAFMYWFSWIQGDLPGGRSWVWFANSMVIGLFVVLPALAAIFCGIMLSIFWLIARFTRWLMKP